ncbi:MAG: hypothetical protein JO360_00445, partial [Acidobacteria bacterium]|nr:hypothetical protein [Acidobacteriota bacterium]
MRLIRSSRKPSLQQYCLKLVCAALCLALCAGVAAAAGTLDPTFGTGGEAPPDSLGVAFLLQPDGKILAAGSYYNAISDYNFTVARYNSDGSPDTSFGTNGRVVTVVTEALDWATCAALQPDGKIVVGGYSAGYTSSGMTLVRYNPDGSLDSSFGDGGIFFKTGYTVYSVAIQPDGRIVVGGQGGVARGSNCSTSLMLARLTSDGTLDPSFGTLRGGRGVVLVPLGSGPNCMTHDMVSAIYVRPDGRILVGGGAYIDLKGQFVIGEFDQVGEPLFLTTYRNGREDALGIGFRFVRPQADGKIVAISIKIARFNGPQLDPTFLPNSQLMLSSNTFYDGNGVFLPGGKIVRYTYVSPPEPPYTLTVNLESKNSGVIGQLISHGPGVVRGVLAQPDGKIIVFSDKMRRYLTISDLAGKQSDFDGDRRTEIGYFRPADGTWSIRRSTGGVFNTNFGVTGDYLVPGRYTGSASAIAVYRPSNNTWYVNSLCGTQVCQQVWGVPGDVPVGVDYDGDGRDDFATFKDGAWRILQSSDGQGNLIQWGTKGDKPVPGDYDYDGFSDLAVYRPANGTWYIRLSSNGSLLARQFGGTTDLPLTGDFDADGRTDPAVFRPSSGVWYILNSKD